MKDCRGGRAPDLVTARTEQNNVDAADSAESKKETRNPDISAFCEDIAFEGEDNDVEMDQEWDESKHKYSNRALIEGSEARPGKCKAVSPSLKPTQLILQYPRTTCWPKPLE